MFRLGTELLIIIVLLLFAVLYIDTASITSAPSEAIFVAGNTIEVFSDGSRNPEGVKKDILADTGMTPSIHDHGMHYVINHKISLETLERIQKYTDVQEIKGEYSGSAASSGAAHERRERDHG